MIPVPPPDADYEQRCRAVLEQALSSVPAYAGWRARDPGPGALLDERYAALPVLTKALLRKIGPAAFVSPGHDLDRALAAGDVGLVATSGTTEERIHNVWYQTWWDRSEQASWKLNAHAERLSYGKHREAILTGPMQAGIPCEHGTLPMARRLCDRFLYLNEKLSPEHWTPALMDRMLAELEQFEPLLLEANPSLLARLARHAADQGRRVYQPALIVLTYENPTRPARRAIRRVFDAPVASSYGSTESGYVFMECEHARLHQVTASCRVDLVPWEHGDGDSPLYRIVVTTFDNPWRVLLRFDTGDLAGVSKTPCPCGNNNGWVLDAIEGRAANVTFSVGGAAVAPGTVDRVLGGVPGVFDYRVTQHDPARIVARVMDWGDGRQHLELRVKEALHGLYGDAVVEVDVVDALAPGPSGKFRKVQYLGAQCEL